MPLLYKGQQNTPKPTKQLLFLLLLHCEIRRVFDCITYMTKCLHLSIIRRNIVSLDSIERYIHIPKYMVS